jgi:hypothetical protein
VKLAELFALRRSVPDFVVFYGCAGVLQKEHTRSVFLIEAVNYLSLGTVVGVGASTDEKVALKNKWLCHTPPPSDVKGSRPKPVSSPRKAQGCRESACGARRDWVRTVSPRWQSRRLPRSRS